MLASGLLPGEDKDELVCRDDSGNRPLGAESGADMSSTAYGIWDSRKGSTHGTEGWCVGFKAFDVDCEDMSLRVGG